MRFQQLQFLMAVYECDLNITVAARRLKISQPGISRQLKDLEAELGFHIFERHGRSLIRVTPAGEEIIERAGRILREIQNIRRVGTAIHKPHEGTLSLATTHTQARYVLPEVVRAFRAKYPKVRLHLHQGTSEQIADMMKRDDVDFAILTGSEDLFPELLRLPVYRWNRTVVVPHDHPLASGGRLTLARVARYPIVTYVFSFSGRSSLQALFDGAGLTLNASLTARDADVIKTYVRCGLGVGIVASMAIDTHEDRDLAVLDASHLLESHTTWLGFRRGTLLSDYMYDFIAALAPHLSPRFVKRAEAAKNLAEVKRILKGVRIPRRTSTARPTRSQIGRKLTHPDLHHRHRS
jgi:LysR family transcriptional regulator, cys regulon transcriptional activator